MELRELSTLQIIFVYNTYMMEDFPPEELKPLDAILKMMDLGMYECIGLYDQNEFLAYGYFLKDSQRGMLLLDYLAVDKAHRGCGVGSVFLEQLKTYYDYGNALLLECESQRTAKNEEERRTRSRRIGFYKRNGCVATSTKCNLFGVEYDILYLPWTEGELQMTEELDRMYQRMLTPEQMAQYVKIWERHGILSGAWTYEKGDWTEKASLTTALRVCLDGEDSHKIISFVGAGGKTTTMYQLADELAEQGKRVLVTTSTHIRKPESRSIELVDTWENVKSYTWEKPIVVLGRPMNQEKLSAPDGLGETEVIEALKEAADVILIEADGAKALPLKVPAEYEPVLIPQTDMVIACVGLQALGKTFSQACFRKETAGKWLRRSGEDLIESDDVVLILMDERGSRKQVTTLGADYRIVLNQGDGEKEQKQALEIVQKLPLFLQPVCVMTAYEGV